MPKKQAKQTYKVMHDLPRPGKIFRAGDSIELTPRAAKYHLLKGVLQDPAAKPKQASTKPETPADSGEAKRAKR